MSDAQDHFSEIAKAYKDGRVSYPSALYKFLVRNCKGRELAWDCATGTGQAAVDLSQHFDRVIATDISAPLLAQAERTDNIEFRKAPGENSGIQPGSLDLAVVAQGIHWLDLPKFWDEVARVLKPNGILAFWGYLWPSVNGQVDDILEEFKDVIASFWPDNSKLIHDQFADVEAPFIRVDCPRFCIEEDWIADQYLMHLASWSGTHYCRKATGADPLISVSEDLTRTWGGELRRVTWPLLLKVYRNAELDA